MGISGQKRGIFGDFREKWRAETGKHRTSSMESSEVSATNIRCFMQRSPVFWGFRRVISGVFTPLAPSIFSDMPQKNVHFHHTAMGKYTRNYQMNLRLQGNLKYTDWGDFNREYEAMSKFECGFILI